ncbi:hypothetical protein RFI_31616 [Reticulomyxa filosa]|uniref:Uncharacterized protein n=1 Tax=Reticulomyxa filosa TaxID=46433 RepID=X6LYH5_RETFI|nr:hypothetical protein RFI_31616 [Reticulomyxa filosa]|eukprot:ETO05785.1 hypothetical protein RFI_31616 [Reticulomyxa filosa]
MWKKGLNEDKKEEKSSSQNEETGNGNDLLKDKLEYCISCVEWKKLLIKYRNNIKIFDNLWKFIQSTLATLNTAFVDSLTNGVSLRLENLRAFFYLEFPSSLDIPFELKENLVSREIEEMMIKTTEIGIKEKHFFSAKVEQALSKEANGSQHSFIQTYQTIVNNIITLGWIRVLLSLYENCYFHVVLFLFVCLYDTNIKIWNNNNQICKDKYFGQ